MNVEIGTETPIFLFWEYLFRNIGILSLKCWEMGGQEGIWVAKKGFGWPRRDLGGQEGSWVAKKGEWVDK
jgi:hypothetical protein